PMTRTKDPGAPMSPFPRCRLALVLAPLLVLGLVAAGCGDDDSDDATKTDNSSNGGSNSDNSENLASDSNSDGGDTRTDVVAVDYHFQGLPERADAGSRLTRHNDSEGEVHELVAMATPATETRSVEELTALPEGELFAAVPGEPAMVLVAPPGEDAIP